MKSIPYLGHYLNGNFEHLNNVPENLSKDHISPANFKDKIWTAISSPTPDIDRAFEKGKASQLPWAKLSFSKRREKLLPLKKIIQKKEKELAEIVSRETGKPLWESQMEVKALLGKVDFTLNEGLKRIKEQKIAPAGGYLRYRSRGLLVVIGPFNFPLHLPFGQILPALVAGNTVLFKPSEKTPASGQKLAECFHKLNLPKGLFQMIQGGANISQKLCAHKKGDGVLFTGSFEVGQKIKEKLLLDHNKILVLEMGGYNSTLIWDYKKPKRVLSETLKGCFLTAGQRCSSTSQIIVHKKIAKKFIKDFVSSTQKISVDYWNKNPFMGSLIDKFAVQRFFKFQKEIENKKGAILLEGKKLKDKKGYYVRPGIYKMKFNKNSSFGKTETFTPQVVVYETEDLEEALEMIHHSEYGLSLSVFSESKKVKEEIFHRAKTGLINYNLSSVGASGYLPFGGLGKSGNDRPGGSFAIDSCVTPVAIKTL